MGQGLKCKGLGIIGSRVVHAMEWRIISFLGLGRYSNLAGTGSKPLVFRLRTCWRPPILEQLGPV